VSVFVDPPYAALSFGDLCSGFPWFDASLRADASLLRREQAPASFAEKRFGIDRLVDFFVLADGDVVKPIAETDFLLAHGREWAEAVCVSDDCHIETALGRDGRDPTGFLRFAPVGQLGEGQTEKLTRSLRRHPLGEGRVVELHRTFQVRAGDILAAGDDLKRRSLGEDARAELASRWAAHSCRTGPLVAQDNAEKLAALLIADGWPEDRAAELATALVGVSALSWRLEAAGLESAGQEHDDHRDDLAEADVAVATDGVREGLEELRDQASRALALLDSPGP
jgi:hypothetical protein